MSHNIFGPCECKESPHEFLTKKCMCNCHDPNTPIAVREGTFTDEEEMSTDNRPEIVVLCGSTRFKKEFEEINRHLTLSGKIVLSVGVFGHDELGDEELAEWPSKAALDELHKRKIDLADRVFVLNVGGYIGESTKSEIDYALDHDKPIDWLEIIP